MALSIPSCSTVKAPALRKAVKYAQKRARETGKPYIVSAMGHAIMATPSNKKLMRSDMGHIACIAHKRKR